jgi:Domain of unknown function (DUF4258)
MYCFVLTKHAITTTAERNIKLEWIERTLRYPARVDLDERDASLHHALLPISENDNRVLRVVFDRDGTPFRVITAFFDRSLRNKL